MTPEIVQLEEGITLYCGDNRDILPLVTGIDACVTDPPYGLGKEPEALEMLRDWMTTGHHDVRSKSGFMGKEWDAFVPQPLLWKQVSEAMKPGSHMLTFAGTRTQDIMGLGVRIAGFEMRDCLMWVYGSGFPKSLDVGKALPEWDGWGTALKPAYEPILLVRKPIEGTVAENVLKHGVGGINIDGCRVHADDAQDGRQRHGGGVKFAEGASGFNQQAITVSPAGRWPANFLHDGDQAVMDLFPESIGNKGIHGKMKGGRHGGQFAGSGASGDREYDFAGYGDSGSAARFFYTAKTSKADRNEGCEELEDKEWRAEGACIPERGDRPFLPSKNNHPTVKPTTLMQYLCRLITPPNGIILDPFMGSGSTGKAAVREGFRFIGIEQDPSHFKIAVARIRAELKNRSI